MRVVVLNRFEGHETYAARICRGLADAGHTVRYLGPQPVGHGTHQAIRLRRARWRRPRPPLRGWAHDLHDRRAWRLRDADVVVDLHASRLLWSSLGRRNVRVIHRLDPFVDGRAGAVAKRARLRWLARRGDRFVVHTTRAREVIAGVVGDAAVERIALMAPDPRPRPAHEPSRPMTLLFVGTGRDEKGYDLLEAAARETGDAIRQVGGVGYPLSDEQLVAAYAECDLVVCPYRDRFAASGAGSLVVTEAMAYGVPVLAAPALRDLFPDDYGGVEFAAAATVGALADALRSVDLAGLSRRAAEQGPPAAARTSPRAYATALLALARRSGSV